MTLAPHSRFRPAILALFTLGLVTFVCGASAQDAGLRVDGAVRYPDGSLQTTAVSGVAPVLDSGQATCWDATGTERDCAGTGEDGDHLAGLSFVSPRFTDHGDGTVTDHQTGLMWLKDADCGWGSIDWQAALDIVADFNEDPFSAGVDCDEFDENTPPYTDWRLPSLHELRSLAHFGAASPAVGPGHPFIDVLSTEYWTSTSYANTQAAAWTVDVGSGLNLFANKGNPRRVWLVRGTPTVPTAATSGANLVLADGGLLLADGTVQSSASVITAPLRASGWTTCHQANGQARLCAGTGEDGEFQFGVAAPIPRFADRGDGTVLDNFTGLIWLQDADCPAGNRTWQQALDWVDDLNTMSIACTSYAAGSFTDWRLPNASELLSLNDLTASDPALSPGIPFVNVNGNSGDHYWSSTTWPVSEEQAIATDMFDGLQRFKTKTDTGCCWVWPVRGGR